MRASPLLWGTEEHVRELLGEAEFERREVEWRDASVESYADFMLESFGPLLNAQEVLGERKGELRTAYIGFLNEVNMRERRDPSLPRRVPDLVVRPRA